MSKQYKKKSFGNGAAYGVKDRLDHRGIYCITPKWIKWAKRYLNKAIRREKFDEGNSL